MVVDPFVIDVTAIGKGTMGRGEPNRKYEAQEFQIDGRDGKYRRSQITGQHV